MRKKLIAGVVCAGMVFGFGATAAEAGEITGNGKSLKPLHANSICAFSGQNDDPGLDGFGQVQSWGQIPKADRDFLRSIGESPSVQCNGHLNPYQDGGGEH